MIEEEKELIIAAQDGRQPLRNYQVKIIKIDQAKYEDCAKKKTESIDHLVPSCPILTPIEYKEKHVKIGHYIN